MCLKGSSQFTVENDDTLRKGRCHAQSGDRGVVMKKFAGSLHQSFCSNGSFIP